MRILVTGSQGTIGRALVEALRARDHEVFGCDVMHSGDRSHIRADVAIRHQLERAFSQSSPEAVYHLAAEFGRLNGELYTEQLWRTAMVGTRNVLELCLAHESHLIFGSSSEVYGEADADLLSESLIQTEFPNEYALSKFANERQIAMFRRRHGGPRATILRFFNAYGPGEVYHPYRSVVALFCARALAGEPLPVFRGYQRTFMYIADFIPTLARACEAELRHPIYNIGGEDYRSVEDLARLVLEEAREGDGEIELIGEDTHNVRSKRPDNARAREDLGHEPSVLLEQGVPATLEWMRSRERGASLTEREPA
jgi:dTDP-glucose 4,6-dehydratase